MLTEESASRMSKRRKSEDLSISKKPLIRRSIMSGTVDISLKTSVVDSRLNQSIKLGLADSRFAKPSLNPSLLDSKLSDNVKD